MNVKNKKVRLSTTIHTEILLLTFSGLFNIFSFLEKILQVQHAEEFVYFAATDSESETDDFYTNSKEQSDVRLNNNTQDYADIDHDENYATRPGRRLGFSTNTTTIFVHTYITI